MMHKLDQLLQHVNTRHEDGYSRWKLPWKLGTHLDKINH